LHARRCTLRRMLFTLVSFLSIGTVGQEGRGVRPRGQRATTGLWRQGDQALRVASSQELLVRASGRCHLRSANATEHRSLDSGWRRSCTASGPQLHCSLGSTGQSSTPPHYSLDPVHGPGVGPGLWPQFLPPTCSRRECSVGTGFFPLRGVFAAFSRPLLVSSFSLCDLLLFVIKRIVHLNLLPKTLLAQGRKWWVAVGAGVEAAASQRGGRSSRASLSQSQGPIT
jgi:hypothetical protein